METVYLALVVFLFLLATFDLSVGVSNDAVNFLNSALGAKAATFKVIMAVAAVGIFTGASISNGMMDVARHGIFQPQFFTFQEIMFILLAVMMTDVVILDIFNSLGMPTSTTVSLVFELLGGTCAMALMKIINTDGLYSLGDLVNTDKALSVILAIFTSVAIAFIFGAIVQYIARLIFTFNYKGKMRYTIGLFGGIAATAIVYFVLISGLKHSSIMTKELLAWIKMHTGMILWSCFIGFTILMQILHWCKVNVFKVVVLLGTFALAMAFASNDLVNFIGVPLVGYSSYIDFTSNGGGQTIDTFLMNSLLESAHTPWYFLVGSGTIMIIALVTSKKAQNVIKTSLNLARQEEGEESFGTSSIARALVRNTSSISCYLLDAIPNSLKKWLDSRFQKDEIILENGAAFDLVRASINLVLAGGLIAIGTSLKLPLSTTYVTFMVAMGSSLADRAWGRESAVYRITGVISVIGGWFITAGIAFIICFIVTSIIHFGGLIAIIVMIAAVVFMLIRSQLIYKNKIKKEEGNLIIRKLLKTENQTEAFQLLRQYTNEEFSHILDFANQAYIQTIQSFVRNNFRGLQKTMNAILDEKARIKQFKRMGTMAMQHIDEGVVLDKGLYYYQGNDFASEIIYSLKHLCEPCLEHIDNNFNPIDDNQKEELILVSNAVAFLTKQIKEIIEQNAYGDTKAIIEKSNRIINKLSILKKEGFKHLQEPGSNIKAGMVYLSVIQESQNFISYMINLVKISKKFQVDEQENYIQ